MWNFKKRALNVLAEIENILLLCGTITSCCLYNIGGTIMSDCLHFWMDRDGTEKFKMILDHLKNKAIFSWVNGWNYIWPRNL